VAVNGSVAASGERIVISSGDLATLDIDAIVQPVADGDPSEPHRFGEGDAIAIKNRHIRAKWVIQVVPPFSILGEFGETLRWGACYRAVLRRASELGVLSLAMPELVSGVHGAAMERIAHIAVRETRAWCRVNARPERIVFCLQDPRALPVYRGLLGTS
jgi:O-acetyl-ADP-ribose deacetylase (regulator of RNase III)